jgi:hypothetical protein
MLLVLKLESPTIAYLQQEIEDALATFAGENETTVEERLEKLDASLISVTSDSMALLPGCIAIADCGDLVILRAGDGLLPDQQYHGKQMIYLDDLMSSL